MERDTIGVVIVADLALRAMHQLSFKDIVKATLEANMEIQALHLYMRHLCEAIIRRIYHFEDDRYLTQQPSLVVPRSSVVEV